jgi:hypothetical protein
VSNQSTIYQQMLARVPTYGYAVGRGNSGAFSDMGRDLFVVTRDDHETDVSIVKPFYIDVRECAERDAIAGGKPLKEQKEKSRNIQINKMENFAHVGIFARANDDVTPAFDYAHKLVAGGYTKLVKCLTACKAELGKNAGADFAALKAAIDKSLEETPVLLSEALTLQADAFDKLVHGDKTGPSDHEAMLARLLSAYPQDYVKHVAQCYADMIAKVVSMEQADAAKIDKAAGWSH